MSMLIPPQMINTMEERDLRHDRVRNYMAPALSDRQTEWTSHPMSSRDSLHEADMWAVEGLTHRYPTKVLAELIPTCPQYCGHCTRMDLVGNDTLQVLKYKFEVKQNDRWDQMLDYLRKTPQVRDVVVSGGDMANVPIKRLEDFVSKLIDIENIRDIRIASKGLMGLPQHFLQDDVRAGLESMATKARSRGVDIALHTHVNCAQQVTPLVGKAAQMTLEAGFRDVRNQGVLLRGVNTAPNDLLELCFMLLDHAKIMPYYFYMCDMIPNAEHWRTSVAEAQDLQYRAARLHAGVRHATGRVRRAVRRQALGAHAEGLRPRQGDLVLDEELPDRHRGSTIRMRSRAGTRTTTRSTRCPRRASSGGGNRWRPTNRPRSRRERQPFTTTLKASAHVRSSSWDSTLYECRLASMSSVGNTSGLSARNAR